MIGTLINERYRLDSELGLGGMGTVYRAHDILLDRDVAVKVLSDPALSPESYARLLREAQAAAQLNHPNIVSVHDAGEADPPAGVAQSVLSFQSSHDPDDVFHLVTPDYRKLNLWVQPRGSAQPACPSS